MILNDTVTFLIQLLNHIKNHQPLSFGEWMVVISFVVWCISIFIYMNKGFSITGNSKKSPSTIIIRFEHVSSPDSHEASSQSKSSPPQTHTQPELPNPEDPPRPKEPETASTDREDS